MNLAPKSLITWDFWLVQEKTTSQTLHHAFFLQAPKDQNYPENRHNFATVGHSVSTDLINWCYRGTAINKGLPGTWNDMANWTGSVIQTHTNDYMMMITGRSTIEAGRVQRLGVFYSKDLFHWQANMNNPLLECDENIYHPTHHLDQTTTWRDPWLFCDKHQKPNNPIYYALITAQAKKNDRIYGVIGVAALKNSNDWVIEEPLSMPDYFKVMECPVVFTIDDEYYLFINIDKHWIDEQAPESVERKTGTHLLKSKHLKGPYTYVKCVLDGGIDVNGQHHWGKYQLFPAIIDEKSKTITCVHWRGYNSDGQFEGGLSEPFEIQI